MLNLVRKEVNPARYPFKTKKKSELKRGRVYFIVGDNEIKAMRRKKSFQKVHIILQEVRASVSYSTGIWDV